MKIVGTLKRAGNLLEKKSFIVTVIVINCIVIFLLVGCLFFLKAKNQDTVSPIAIAEEQVNYSDRDSEMANIYVSLLEGTKFDLGDGIVFSFGLEGKYAGFFDTDHKNVKDYHYKVDMKEDNILLSIYDKKETQLVSYNISFDQDGNMLLRHPDMKKTIKLEF